MSASKATDWFSSSSFLSQELDQENLGMRTRSGVNPSEADREHHGTRKAGVLRVSMWLLAGEHQARAAGCIPTGFDLLFQREGELVFG